MNVFGTLILLLLSSIIHGRSDFLTAKHDIKEWTVPWIEPDIIKHDFFVSVSVNGFNFSHVPVDTGSTGFLIAATKLNYTDENQLIKLGLESAFEYLSSSRRYYKGYWLPSNLTFTSIDGIAIESRVPILAVVETGKCQEYPKGQSCLNTTKDRKRIPDPEIATQYMGVGFGRLSNEQPHATVDKNAFLNIDFKGDETLRSGYIISDTGVVLGIRSEDLQDGWNTTQLTENTNTNTPPGSRPEWFGTPMCVEVAGSSCSDGIGTVLFDTGINYCNLGVAPETTEHFKHCSTPTSCELNNHIEVRVRIGSLGHYVAEHSFTVGETKTTPMVTPPKVKIVKMHGNETFVNTGRYFYNKFSLIFDHMSGTVGLKDRTIGETILETQMEDVDSVRADEL